MANQTKRAGQNSFEGLSLRARIIRDTCLGLIAIIAFLAVLSNLSFNAGDPSFNVASNERISNWLGSTGANFADLMVQLFGLAALPISAFAGGTAIFALLKGPNGIERGKRRFWVGFIGIILLCVALAGLPASSKWPMATSFGGLLGDVLIGAFTIFFEFSNFSKMIVSIVAAISCAYCAYYAFNLRLNDLDSAADAAGYYWASFRVWYDKLFQKRQNYSKPKTPRPNAAPMRNIEIDEDLDETEKLARRFAPPQSKKLQEINVNIPKASKSSVRETIERQPSLPLGNNGFELPRLELLTKPPIRKTKHDEAALKQNALLLRTVLSEYKIQGEIIKVRPGPVVTLYELEPEAGIKGSRVIALSDDIARSMAAISCRVAVVKGRNAIGIELPNHDRESVYLRSLLASREYEATDMQLPLALGETIGGEPSIVDLAKMPHLLIAGTTGSGKSVGINAMILSLLYRLTPEECRFIMIDPKMLELSVYDDIPHLLTPVVTDPKKAVCALKWTVQEMENRYRLMSQIGVRNISGYNERAAMAKKTGETIQIREKTGVDRETGQPIIEIRNIELKPMPFIVVVIDEMADLMLVAGKDIEVLVQRLAQMARAAGIHLIMATQRPSVDVITGTIKANFPTRISYMVTSKIDSRTILGEGGADQLLGQGDLLFMAGGGRISRHHGPYVSDEEVRQIVATLKAQGKPEYFGEITADPDDEAGMNSLLSQGSGDELFDKAVAIVATERKVSTSFLQRQLRLGYNRAADLVDRMEREGMISAPNHVGKREILMPDHSF